MTLWIAYIAGAVCALGFKLIQCRRKGGKIAEYFFASGQTSITTVTTFGVAWLLGAVYIGSAGDWGFPQLPRHPSLAFVLGSLAEVVAPQIVQQIQARLTITKGGKQP